MFACLLFFSICKGEPVGATSHGDPAFNPYLILMMVAWSGRRFPLLSPACISKARYPLEILGTFWDAAMRDWTSSIRKVRNHHPIKLSFWRLYYIYMCVYGHILYTHPSRVSGEFSFGPFLYRLGFSSWIPGSSWQVAAANGFKPLPQRKCHGSPMTCQEILWFRMIQVSVRKNTWENNCGFFIAVLFPLLG